MQRVSTSVDVPVYIDAADTPDRLAVALNALRLHQLGSCTAVVDLSEADASAMAYTAGRRVGKSRGLGFVLTGSALSNDETRSSAMDVLGGLKSPGRHEVIANRAAAIRWAVHNTDQGCILLAGCGSEAWATGQEGLTTCDDSVARSALQRSWPI